MNKAGIFKSIEMASVNAKVEKMEKNEITFNRVIKKVMAIQEKYCSQVDDLLDMALYAISKGYPIQPKGNICFDALPNVPMLMADAISNEIGFVGELVINRFSGSYKKYPNINGIGFNGSVVNFIVTPDSVFFRKNDSLRKNIPHRNALEYDSTTYWCGLEQHLDKFIAQFDEFKAKVENWLENISSYKNYLA